MEAIQQNLQRLQALLKSSDRDRHGEAAQICRDLYSLCLERTNDTELAFTTSVIFNAENGVLQFLKSSAKLDEFSNSKEEILRLLAHYLQALSKKLLPYAVEIKDVCLTVFTRDRTSKVKTAVFPVLTEILQLCSSTAVSADLDVPSIAKKFFEACIKATKLTATVRGGVFHLLGTLCELYPEHMAAYSMKLADIYLKTLKDEMLSQTKKSEMQVIAGCLRGLGGYLTNFEQETSGESPHAKEIFRFTRMSIDPQVPLSRFDVPRAGLSLLTRHAAHFSEFLTKDYQDVYHCLFTWCNHSNREMKNLGFLALESFFQQVSDQLVKDTIDEKYRKTVFTDFIKTFRGIIDDKSSGHREMAVAIRGYGYFAVPCRVFMTEGDVRFMFTEMMQRSQHLFYSQSGLILGDNEIYHLPSFLSSLASILKKIDELSAAFLAPLERLVVILVEHYPRLSVSSAHSCHVALLQVLLSLVPKGPLLHSFVSHVVYQGLIRTCSHQIVLDVDEDSGVVLDSSTASSPVDILGTKQVSYMDYVPLWVAACSRGIVKKLTGESPDTLNVVHSLVFDELMAAILKIIGKLDLTSYSAEQDEELQSSNMNGDSKKAINASSDNELFSQSLISNQIGRLQPTKPPDFQIFINLVDFFRKILPKMKPLKSMEKWMFSFVHDLITISSKLPLVSGFYKMLSSCMKVSRTTGYFKTAVTVETVDEVAMETEALTDRASRTACFSLMKKFTEEVLTRMKQYKDDLVVSCLNLLLSLPNELVEQEIDGLMNSLQTALKLGLGYLPLARASLDALETWGSELPSSLLEKHYGKLLPVLDDYLKSPNDSSEGERSQLSLAGARTGADRKKRLPFKAVKAWKESMEGANSPVGLVRLRVVNLLGSLGGKVNIDIISGQDGVFDKAVSWDPVKRLDFDLPFQDMKPSIYLDSFLPVVCELALTSSDRQTKIAACELLHAVAVYVIGKGAQPGGMKKYSMTNLYKKLFPVVLQLACDVERVAEQLFRPLVFQCIHWFTGNTLYESPDTIVLLEAILEGIVSPDDAALRDLSAQCVKEFLQWSIKQTTKQQQEKSPINTKSVLKRLYSMASHPSAAKRLGAALAFNSIYTVFREESSLVDIFVMEMLVCVVNSLKLAHKDPKSLGTQDEISKTIGHLTRVIKARASILNKSNKRRRIPRGLREAEMRYLVNWVLTQCGAPETACRAQCMTLFMQLAPVQQDIPSAQAWIQRTVASESGLFFVSQFERGGQGHTGILTKPTPCGHVFSLVHIVHWFDLLLAPLDAYTWAFENNLLSPSDVFKASPKKTSEKPSKLFSSLDFFLTKMTLGDISAAAQCCEAADESSVYTPHEKEEYNRAKCSVVLKIIKFVQVLMVHYKQEVFSCTPESFWSEPLYQVLVACCLKPDSAGFEVGNVEAVNRLPDTLTNCLVNLSNGLPSEKKSVLVEYLRKRLLEYKLNLFHQPRDGAVNVDQLHLKLLVAGYIILNKTGLLKPTVKSWESLPGVLLDTIMKVVHQSSSTNTNGKQVMTLDPGEHQLCLQLLQLSLDLEVKPDVLVKVLLSGFEGRMLYQNLQSQICSHLAVNHKTFIPLLVEEAFRSPEMATCVLGGVVDQVLKNLSMRIKHSSSLYEQVLGLWGQLGFLWGERFSLDLRITSVTLLKKILTLEPNGLGNADESSFASVFGTVQTLLEETQTTLSFKASVLELLPFFSDLNPHRTQQLRMSLNKMVAQQFPLRSTEFPAGSSMYHEYTAAVDKLLQAFVTTGSPILLEVLVGTVCREEAHVCEQAIQSGLSTFAKNAPGGKVRAALETVHTIFTNESQHEAVMRCAVANRILLTLMKNCLVDTIKEFFIEHISDVMAVIEAKESKMSEKTLEDQLRIKTSCLNMMEVLYLRLSAQELNSTESEINRAYNKGERMTGKELTKAITKVAHTVRSEYTQDSSPTTASVRRTYHCSAYNLLAAIIMCTQSKLDFYNVFLFKEDLSKGQMLWDNIIDIRKQYHFDIELDTPLERKKQLTAIRDRLHSESASGDGDSGDSPTSPPGGNILYLSSVYLAGSSLSQDVSQFDFSTGTQMMPRVSIPTSAAATEQSYVVSEEHIEQDELNMHECMGTFMKLLDHMEHNRITPQVQKGTPPSDMPPWMSALHRKLTDGKTHTNIRLFIARLITNRPRVFQPYAKFWLPPLVQLVVSGNTCGEGLHYFVVDVVVTLLMWSGTAVLEDTYLATRLLQYLMDNCHHDNRAVFRNNLEIIKSLVECWKSHFTFPTESVYRLFSDANTDGKRNRAGIQLLGVMLANGLCPYEPSTSGGVTEERYYRALVSNLGNKYKEIYAATAEVLGMTLNYISEHAHTDVGPLHDLITDQLLALLQTRDEDKFTVCFHKLAKAYPPLVDRLYSKVLFILPGQHAAFKTMSLEILLARADSIPNLYAELKAKGFSQALRQRDEEMQLAALGILEVMVRTMTLDQVTEVLPQVTSFSTHPSHQCRALMYDTLVWIYNSLHSAEEASSEQKDELVRMTRDQLLAGLSDEADSNRLKLFAFWNQESLLPSDTLGRLTQVFSVLYSPSTESQFLGYTTNLMLELTSRSPDYNRSVFDTPLSECKFQDQMIDLSWQQRHLQMTPLFAATQASQSGTTFGPGMGTGMLRSTQQSLAFQPTLDMAPGDSVGYNWMTPTVHSMESLSFTVGSGGPVSTETPQPSALLFSRSREPQQTRKLKPLGEGFGKGTLQSLTTAPSTIGAKDEQQASISKLKRRFLKDRQSSSAFYARLQVKKKQNREESRKYQKAARDSRVVMYRKYREGELPDIQIKYSEIIRPLQALAQRDGTLGKMLFTCVFSAIFGDIDKHLTEADVDSTQKAVRQCLNTVLSSSTQYDPSFIGSLQSICFEQKDFDVGASSTATACLASSQQPMGIMVLEKQLLHGTLEEDRAHTSKRSRISHSVTSETTSNWIELARLYKSLGEYDVLRGIFSGHIGAKKITKDALEAEERSDYKKALDLYKEGLSCDQWADGDPTDAEQDFWDRSQLNCYDHLVRWKELEEAVELNIDDTSPPKLDKVWEDSYCQEHYLPYLVRSKVKLAAAGVQDSRFGDFLETSLQEESKKAILESRYSSDLAMHYIIKNDYNRAKYYVDISMQGFLQEWCTLSQLFEENRAACLRELQKLVEIREFFDFTESTGSVISMSAVDRLLEKWGSRFPHPKHDPISLWDDIVTNRCVLMEKMLLKCKESSADISSSSLESMEVEFGSSFLQNLQQRFSKEYVKLYLKISETARIQGNYAVAKHYLQLTERAKKDQLKDDKELPLKWLWSVTEMKLQQSREDKSPRCVEAIVAVLKQFSTFADSDVVVSSPCLSRHHHHLHATALQHLANLLVDRATGPRLLDAFGDDKIHHLLTVAHASTSSQVGSSTRDHKKVAGWLYMKALATYKQALKAGQEEFTAGGDIQGMISGYVSLASFCDRALRAEEDKVNNTQLDIKSFPRVVVVYMLKALEHGSIEARQQFPRLLQILELYPETVNEFIKKSKDVPVWMFLGWLNQMMAVLDKPEGRALHDIMFTLAKDYPQALVYPFKISSTSFNFDASDEGRANKEAVAKLQKKLEMRAVDDFVTALEQLTTPELVWKDVCDNELRPLMEPDVAQRDKKALIQAWEQIYSSLFDIEGRTGLSAQSSESLYGTPSTLSAGQKQRKFVMAYRNKIEEKFGKDGRKLASLKYQDYHNFVNRVNNEMRENLNKVAGSGLLKEYSPWLVTFQPSLYPQYIEVPGQYTGDSKPLLDYHVKIAGFDEKILVLSSIRKPKRITIRGDDEKEYMFLVKGGEDLRLDQRIEQLFGVMNRILKEDPACCQRGLYLTTYNVIPMTPRVGIIEWVQKTKPLKDFLLDGMNEDERKKYTAAQKAHLKWLSGFSVRDLPPVQHYKEMYKKANRTNTEKEYKKMVGAIPWDLSRRTFMQLAASPEAFLMLRSHFIKTYSTLCICHYILGIGDRHLSNFMIELTSGGMVGIDFGHAFGTATQFLPLPELIPFRLTPQIINLLLPQSESGQLRSCMIHTMRALRQSPLVLLNTMDVFVKEPSLDWKVNARKQASVQKNTESQEDSWYPREKVDQAKKTLEGYNPAHIMKMDLSKGHSHTPEHASLDSLLMGDRHFNVRARVEVQCSSVEEQVACLIDQATDANILGRTWQGWEPWV